MQKKSEKQTNRDTVTAAKVKMVADAKGLSPRSVKRIINGDQKNEKVLDDYMSLDEGINLLVQAIKKSVPL